MDTNTKRLHPLLTIAAISVTLFSAVGVAAISGLIPHSKGSVNRPTPVVAEAPPPAVVAEPAPAPTVETAPPPQPQKKHVAKKHAPKVAAAETPAMTPPPPPVAQAPQTVE